MAAAVRPRPPRHDGRHGKVAFCPTRIDVVVATSGVATPSNSSAHSFAKYEVYRTTQICLTIGLRHGHGQQLPQSQFPGRKAIDDDEQSAGSVIDQDDIGDVKDKPEQVKPPRPRPKGKAIKDLQAQGPLQGHTSSAAPVRMTADVLAAAEANKLVLPAKRVRTAKVRTN